MASRNQVMTIPYVAWNVDANGGQPGDSSNHTLLWWRDGASGTPTNAGGVTQVSATVMPGVYLLTLTAAETDCNVGVLGGVSATPAVRIYPTIISFERLPSVALGTQGGLPILDSALNVPANTRQWASKPVADTLHDGVPVVEVAYQSRSSIVDGVLAGATSGTVTLPTTDAVGNPIPDDSRYNYALLRIVGGSGQGQVIGLGLKAGTARTYNVSWGMNTPAAAGSSYVIEGTWRGKVTEPVDFNMGQYVPTDGAQQTVADALNMSLASAAGKLVIDPATRLMTLYDRDGVSVARTWLLSPNISAPLSRE